MVQKRYEYRVVPIHLWSIDVRELNTLGAEGWRVVAPLINTQRGEFANSTGLTTTCAFLMEREVS